MAKPAHVSIVVPVHNGGETLKYCLESILTQDFPFQELIVVDNNSYDNTADIILSLARKDNRITYLFDPVQSRGSARQTGLEHSTSDITVMLDADCIAPPYWLETLVQPLLTNPETGAVMGLTKDVINNYWTRNLQSSDENFIKENTDNGHINFLSTANCALMTNLAQEIKFDRKFIYEEDFDFSVRLIQRSKIKLLTKSWVWHTPKSTWFEVFRLNYHRAYWAQLVANKNNLKKSQHPLTQNLTWSSKILFIPWIFKQILVCPVNQKLFLLTYHSAWHAGSMSSLTKLKIKKIKTIIFNLFLSLRSNGEQESDSDLKLRHYRPRDERDLNDIFNKVFNKNRSINEWYDKFTNNSSDFEIIVGTINEKIIGQLCIVNFSGWDNNHSKTIKPIIDISVLPQYRGHLFVKKAYEYIELEYEEKDFYCGFMSHWFPYHQSYVPYIKYLPITILSLDVNNNCPPSKEKSLWTIREINNNDQKILNNLWETKKSEFKIAIKRDWCFINQQFKKNKKKYFTYLIYNREKPVGYIVIELEKEICRLIDILIINKYTTPEVFNLIHTVVKTKSPVKKYIIITTDSELKKIFIKAGFTRVKNLISLAYQGKKRLLYPGDYYATYADIDFRPL